MECALYNKRRSMAIRTQPILLSSVLDALKALGFGGIFLGRQTNSSLVTLEHNARRESRLHEQTDMYEACLALGDLGFEAFDLGMTIMVRRAAAEQQAPLEGDGFDPIENRPGLAKAGIGAPSFEDDFAVCDESFEEETAARPMPARTSAAGRGRRINAA